MYHHPHKQKNNNLNGKFKFFEGKTGLTTLKQNGFSKLSELIWDEQRV